MTNEKIAIENVATTGNEKQKKPSIWLYLGHHKWASFFYCLTTIMQGALDIIQTLLMAQALVKVTEVDYKGAIWLAVTTVIVGIASQFLSWVNYRIFYIYTSKIAAEMNLDLAKQVFKLNSKSFADHDTGTFVQRITSDPARLSSDLANLVDWIVDIVKDVVICVYLATLNIWIALVIVLTVAIGSYINWRRSKARKKDRSKMFKAQDKVNSLTTEIVRSEKDIKSLGLEEKLSQVSKELYDESNKVSCKCSLRSNNYMRLMTLFMAIGGAGLVILGLYLADIAVLTVASFMIIYSYRSSVNNLPYNIGEIFNFFAEVSVSHKRIFALFDEEEYVTEKFGTLDMEIEGGAEVEFKNVGFSYKEFKYPEQKKGENKSRKQLRAEKREHKKNPPKKVLVSENKVFENLSFKIEKNTTVAFVGKSGSGKSTILDLISKMYEVDSGEVLINGVNVNDLSKNSLRSSISLVNQFPYIFDMTIKENLLLANPNATDEDVEIALKKASLDEFVATLPKGVETKVGESGIKLSGGQKQRLAIARAMLRNSSIIIFDESTSSLDNFAQNNVKQSIDNLKGTSTIVIVAHRLSTIKNVDHIFFLDSGKIVDEGTFDELFDRNEMFKTMFMAENI